MIANKFMMIRRAGVAAAVLVLAAPASAALIESGGLTLDTDPGPDAIYQQSEIAPCVIGPTNCQNADFEYTLAGSGGGGSVFSRTSPLYDVLAISSLLGSNAFTIGLDYNQTAVAQTLYEFEARYFSGGALIGAQTFAQDGGTVLQTNNNGVGFSDFLLSGFVIAEGATHVEFFASWWNNNGADRYFLIGSDAATTVPAPASLALLGLGLVGMALIRRRRTAISTA